METRMVTSIEIKNFMWGFEYGLCGRIDIIVHDLLDRGFPVDDLRLTEHLAVGRVNMICLGTWESEW